MGTLNIQNPPLKSPKRRDVSKILLQMKLNDNSLDPRPLPSLHMPRRCSALLNMHEPNGR